MINSNLPLVSVLMTSYNREKYIKEAIESILSSTYQNFELIIVDDQSGDRTVGIAQELAAKDTRVKVYVNEQNLGDYPNRNKAASYANGKYLKYVDADDLIYPHGLELLVAMIERYPNAGYGLCSLHQDKLKIFPFELEPAAAYRYHYFGPGLFHKAPLSSIIRKDAFDRVGGFTPVRMCGDYDMWHKLSQKYNVVLMPQGIVWYREHGEQEMSQHLKYSLNYEHAFIKYIKSEHCPLSEKEVDTILSIRKKTSLKQLIKHTMKIRLPLARLEWQKIKVYKSLNKQRI